MVPESRRNLRDSRRAIAWVDDGSLFTKRLDSSGRDIDVAAAGTVLLQRQVTTISILETSIITTYYTTHTNTVSATLISLPPTAVHNASPSGPASGKSRTALASTVLSRPCTAGAGANVMSTCHSTDGASAHSFLSSSNQRSQPESTPSARYFTSSSQHNTNNISTRTMTPSTLVTVAAVESSSFSITSTTSMLDPTTLPSFASSTTASAVSSTFETDLLSQIETSIRPTSKESTSEKYSMSTTLATSKIATPSSAEPATQATSSATEAQHNAHPHSATILGVAVGGTAALVILLLLIIFVLRRRRFSRSDISEAPRLPPMSAHAPLIVPLPASADPRNTGWIGSVDEEEGGQAIRAPRQQTAITATGLRLVPRVEPPPMITTQRPPPPATHARSESGNHLAPLLPIRNPNRRPSSTTTVQPSHLRVVNTDATAVPSRPTVGSRSSSQTSFDSRTESVYSVDTHGRRRRSDPFSWQNIVVSPSAQR